MKKIMIAAILFLMIFSVPAMAGYHRPFVPSVKKCSVSGCDRPVTENSSYCSGHKCQSRGCKSKRMSGGIYCATHQSNDIESYYDDYRDEYDDYDDAYDGFLDDDDAWDDY